MSYLLTNQVADYNTQPEVSLLAEEAKACLQETEEVPRDITSLFDNSLFKLDTSLVPKVLRSLSSLQPFHVFPLQCSHF